MKRIEVDYGVFHFTASAVQFITWITLGSLTDIPLLVLFFPVFVFFFVLIRVCVRYVFEIRHR